MENEKDKNEEPILVSIERVLEQIREDKVVAHSRLYFNLRIVAIVVVLILVLLLSIFLASFMFYSVRVAGSTSLFGFGRSGWEAFLVLFPWKVAIVDLLLIIVLGFLVRTFRFGYKSPALYLLLGLLVLMFGFGFVVDRGTSVHSRLMEETEQNRFRPVNPLYNSVRHPALSPVVGIYRGVIMSTDPLFVDLDIPGDGAAAYQVVFPGVFVQAPFGAGDQVFIQGSIDGNQIIANGIKVIFVR